MNIIANSNLYLNAFNFSAIGMAIVALDGKILKVNSSLCNIMDYHADELEQMTVQDLSHPEDLESDRNHFNKMLHEDTPYNVIEKRFFKKNGCIVWGLLTVAVVKDENNNPLYYISQIQDITAHKVLQKELETSEDGYRRLIQYSPEPMVIHTDGLITYINEAAVKRIGAKSYKSLMGTKITDYIHPDYKELVIKRIEQILTTNQQLKPHDIKLVDLNGKIIDVSLAAVPVEYYGKKSIQVSLLDITQRKLIEETIRMNEAQYKSLIEYNPDAVFGLDLQGKYTLINDSCTRITGYSKEEFMGISFYSLVVKEDLEKARISFNRALKGITATADLTIIKKNRDQAIVNVSAVPIMIDGTIKGLYAVAKDVTDQRRIEKLIKKGEERYRALVESSPNGIVVHQDGKIVYANPRFMQFVKARSEDEIIGQHIMKFVHPDFHDVVKERIKFLEKNISVESLEEKYVLLDGSIIDTEVIATPIEYLDKPAFQVIIQDISQRKEMERELNQSQELYRSLIENLKEVVFHTDVQGKWTFLNPSWEEITGYTIEESIGNHFYDFVHLDDKIVNIEQFQYLIDGKQEYFRKEVRYITKGGGNCWVEVVARTTFNEQGKITGTAGTLNNITKRKESENELKTSEERFRLLAEYSSDMITMHDINGKYLYVSPACKEILQYNEEDLVGKDAYLFIHSEDLEKVRIGNQTVLDTGYSVFTYRIRRKDGEYVWFESAVKIMNEIGSGEQKLIVVSRNISERKMVEQRLQEANELLQHLSTIDGLTGVSNRRTFDERLELEWNRGLRNSTPLSLIMLDIDYFKAFNDTYGHQGGDGCLKQVASVIQELLRRSTDLLCRYGGEEFCVILPETDEAGAKTVGEKIRSAIESLKIPHSGSKILPWVTISIGTATMIPSAYTSFLDLISNADKAVYEAKLDGRNCVRTYRS